MYVFQTFEIPSQHCYNGQGKAPFIHKNKAIHFIKLKNYMPKYYIYNKKLWQLIHGCGSIYYTPSKIIQVLPILADGIFASKELLEVKQNGPT